MREVGEADRADRAGTWIDGNRQLKPDASLALWLQSRQPLTGVGVGGRH